MSTRQTKIFPFSPDFARWVGVTGMSLTVSLAAALNVILFPLDGQIGSPYGKRTRPGVTVCRTFDARLGAIQSSSHPQVVR